MKKIVKSTLWLVLIIAVAACNRQSGYLEQSLQLAGENRSELEKVLLHYKADPADSLKYRAAVFLISNMAGHFSYTDQGMERYYDALDRVSKQYAGRNDEEAQKALEALGQKFSNAPPVVSDLQIMKAEYLINNIDRSFELWRACCWLEQLEFDDFCEYILPYKTDEMQPLDNWRDYLSEVQYGNLKYLHYTSCTTLRACEKINHAFRSQVDHTHIDFDAPRIRRMNTLISSLKAMDCDDDSYSETAVMRANGVPVAIDFTPRWPNRRVGHSWCVLKDQSGKNIPFDHNSYAVGSAFVATMSKAYRRTFAINPELVELNRSGEMIPPLFRNLYMQDVTDEYCNTDDIAVPVEKCKNKYAYLCTFDNRDWTPVACGEVKGRKAHFKKTGRNVIYLSASVNEEGMNMLSQPFILNFRGEMIPVVPDTVKKQRLTLYRKCPPFWMLDTYSFRTLGSQFQAANQPDFSDAVTVHVVDKFGTESDEIIVRTKEKYRYWRHYSAPEGWGYMAELYFFSKGENITRKGKVIGTRGVEKENRPENLYDNDPLTQFDAPVPTGGWSGLDFGEPVEIERILYAPKADGNCVTWGDEYELKYWDYNRWKSLGRKTAESVYITFDDCPSGALFLLHDCTRGVEDRIFLYENDKQIWW
jgi:hypothetical protein